MTSAPVTRSRSTSGVILSHEGTRDELAFGGTGFQPPRTATPRGIQCFKSNAGFSMSM